MKYVNNSYATKTFYGVEFKPGDVKDVPGYINADGFFRADTSEAPTVEPEIKPLEQEAPKEVEEVKPVRGRKSKSNDTEMEGE